jgi:erythromycin esterase-like protein
MWANEEIVELAEWLRRHNDRLPEEEKAGFYGLDVYSLWESMEAVIKYLERVDPEAVESARRAYKCFEPYGEDVREYARATAFVPTSCEDEVVEMLSELRSRLPEYRDDPESRFSAEQNALVVRGAERYYRAMVRGGSSSWNVRDRHMVETLERLMRHHGPEAKAIVWEHNTHIGDARYTDMANVGMVNVGQLVRDQWGVEDVVLVGFGSHRGSVIAGAEWGAPCKACRFRQPGREAGRISFAVPARRTNCWSSWRRRTKTGFSSPPRHRGGLRPRLRTFRQLRAHRAPPPLRHLYVHIPNPGAPPAPCIYTQGRRATGDLPFGSVTMSKHARHEHRIVTSRPFR